MRVKRIVLDSNVLLSGLLKPIGSPARILRESIAARSVLFSRATFHELSSVVGRSRFERLVPLAARLQFLQTLAAFAVWIEIPGTLRVCRDPDDDKIIETAIIGRAEALVTGDKDLLALRPAGEHVAEGSGDALFQGVAILTPAEFLALAAATTFP
jgi:uncharacterized protein